MRIAEFPEPEFPKPEFGYRIPDLRKPEFGDRKPEYRNTVCRGGCLRFGKSAIRNPKSAIFRSRVAAGGGDGFG